MKQGKGPAPPYYAQGGEDHWCETFFRRRGAVSRVVVDIGAHDGLYKSNSAFFRVDQGWTAYLFDALPRASCVVEARVDAENINDLWRLHGIPDDVDLFSLDVDGNDLWIWKALEARPRVVIVEYNPKWKPRRRRTVPYDPSRDGWDKTEYYGASAGAMVALGQEKGYTLAYSTAYNLIFVLDGLWAPYPLELVKLRSKRERPDTLNRPWVGYP